MGQLRHVSFELLSALHDGELPDREAVLARTHLAACASCRAQQGSLARLEDDLRAPPAMSCEAATRSISSLHDGEAAPAEAELASLHLVHCSGCRAARLVWSAAERALAPLASPSARLDVAMARLVERERRGRRRIALVPPDAAWRAAVVAVLALAIAFGDTLAPADAPAATDTSDTALVAAVQQLVLHRATNTMYVARADEGAVDALDATTYALRARIAVGGRPTALALSDGTDRIMVLDSGAKRLTEIDPVRNTVVASTRLELIGTPTSLQVDNGKIVVSTVVARTAPSASDVATAAAGRVAVFDPATKKLEIVRAVDVAPRLVVSDPRGQRTLLISPDATTVADASYRTIESLVGGVAAAFGDGDRIAVLSAERDAARLTFYGEGAPAPARFAGRALAVIPLPDGRFAVLVETGDAGRIVIVDANGRESGAIEIAVPGRDLAYDAAARRFTVVGGKGREVASVPLPADAAAPADPATAAAATPPSRTAPASAAPAPSAPPSVAPSAPASPTAAPAASPATPSAAPAPGGVPPGAVPAAPDLYRIPLAPGRAPVLVASTSTRVWLLDEGNRIAALDTSSGALHTLAALPRDAVVRALAVGLTHVYAVDAQRGRLFQLAIASEKLSAHPLPALDVSAMTVAPDGTVWVAMGESTQLLAFDPLTKRSHAVDVGTRRVLALAADVGGRVWFSDGASRIGAYDTFEGRVIDVATPGRIAPTVLLADASGRVWAGTPAGEVYHLSSGVATFARHGGTPISALALDASGDAWYLAPVPGGGFGYARVGAARPAGVVGGAAMSLAVGPTARAWLADPSGGIYVSGPMP